jgi:DNA-binding NarL/FixJ family response regulator
MGDLNLPQLESYGLMIILASPNNGLRKRWQQALSGSCPIHEVDNQITLREAITEYTPVVVLIDSNLIRHRGIRQLSTLCQLNLNTRAIFLTDKITDKEAIAVLKAGARGYCGKTISPSLLKKAVDAVKKGEIWTNRRLVSMLLESLVPSGGPSHAVIVKKDRAIEAASLGSLSPRELDVACMIGTGEQNKIISSQLSISEKTVKAHLTNIFKKLGVSSRTQLMLYLHQHDSIAEARPLPWERHATTFTRSLEGV